jgi:hypothetical protein
MALTMLREAPGPHSSAPAIGAVLAAALLSLATPASADEPPAVPSTTSPSDPAPVPSAASTADPPSDAPPTPAEPTPPTDAPEAPPGPAAPPAPAAPATPAAPPTPAAPADPAAPPVRPPGELLRWSGALFRWGHGVSASALGVSSADNYVEGWSGAASSDNDVYTQTFALSGGYFILRRPPHQLRVSTSLAVDVELTNSDTTTYKQQPDLRDIPLRLTYTTTLWSRGDGGPIKGDAAMYDPTLLGRGDHRTWGLVAASLRFPTSRPSQGSGLVLGTSLAVGARQQIKLLGSDAPGLTHLVVTLSETWSHFFHKATTPVNSAVNRTHADGNGVLILSDQLSGVANVENQLTTGLAVALPLYGGLQLDSSIRWATSFPHRISGGSGCDIMTVTGCVDLESGGQTTRQSTSFAVGLSYLILPELAVDLGYSNTADTLAENGRARNPFVSPNALFYAGATFSFDRVYQRFAEPDDLRAMLGEPAPAAPAQ